MIRDQRKKNLPLYRIFSGNKTFCIALCVALLMPSCDAMLRTASHLKNRSSLKTKNISSSLDGGHNTFLNNKKYYPRSFRWTYCPHISLRRVYCCVILFSLYYTCFLILYDDLMQSIEEDNLVYPSFDDFTLPAREDPTHVISINIGNGQDWCKCIEENHIQYAEQNGYSYTMYKERHSNSAVPVKFEKFLYLMDHMQKFNASLILLVDCDIVFSSMSTKIEDVWDKWASPSTDIVIARDFTYYQPGQFKINSGAIIFRPSKWNLRLFYAIIKKGKVPNENLVDQPRLSKELFRLGQLYRYNPIAVEINTKVSIVPQSVMNSFFYEKSGDYYTRLLTKIGLWKPGDWMAHLASRGRSYRMRVVKEMFHLCHNLPETAKLEWNQARSIIRFLRSKSCPHLLVLGVDDSAYLLHAEIPHVSFLEFSHKRHSEIASRMPMIDIHLISSLNNAGVIPKSPFYDTRGKTSKENTHEKWHAILVNSPLQKIGIAGSEETYLDLAMRFLAPQGDIFVNDCENHKLDYMRQGMQNVTYLGYEPRSDGSKLCHYQLTKY